MIIFLENRKQATDLFKNQAKKLPQKMVHMHLLEAIGHSQGFNTHNAFLAYLEKTPHLFDFSPSAREAFIESAMKFGVSREGASTIFRACEESTPDYPIVAHKGCVVALNIDVQALQVVSLFIEHPSNIPSKYSSGRVRTFIVNGIVTKRDYERLLAEIEKIFEQADGLSEELKRVEVYEGISDLIQHFDFEYDSPLGRDPAESLDDDIIVPSQNGGTELIAHGSVLLNGETTNQEIRRLVTTYFDYLLDEINPYSLYDYLVFQRDCAISNA